MVTDELITRMHNEPKRSKRMIGELEASALTFQDVGLTPRILDGTADMHRLISETPLADHNPRDPDPSVDTILDTLAAHVRSKR